MNHELVILEEFSGKAATVYSIILDGESETLFDKFYEKYIDEFPNEITDILLRLQTIGFKTGARAQFFKENEGEPGDGVCAMYDIPESNIRLYCIRYGSVAVILGGGGFKSKSISAYQEDETLNKEAKCMIALSKDISLKIKDGTYKWSPDGRQILT